MKRKDLVMYALGGLIVMAFFAVIYLLIFNESPMGNRDLLNILLGALMASFGNVVNYFYGSSAGSAAKNDIIAGRKNE
jgi:hypothetical protein